ncbi:MAG TPA: YihY/virulence factor BrkB family protein [Acidimicrobiales bacterium]|nr:YihY/virulence factor BrkB family protein [Acidimicrobiales bacterium]
MREKLDALGERYPWLGVALKVQKRYGEVKGSFLAAAVTLMSFISVFPLVLVGIAIVGFISSSSVDLAGDIVSKMGLSGESGRLVSEAIGKAEQSRKAASVIGLAGLLWSGLGLVGAVQQALNTSWQVEGRGLRDKLTGLAWLAGTAVLFAASFAITAAINFLPGFFAPLNIIVGFAINVGIWLWMMKELPNHDVGWKPLLPGAILGAIGLEILKVVGSVYVPYLIKSSSGLYGSLGIVFGVLAWLLLFGKLLVYSSVLNVVLWEDKHGTVAVEVEMPNLPGTDQDSANRSGNAVPAEAVSAPHQK